MGYSKNVQTLRKIEAQLGPEFLRGREAAWHITSGSPDHWAYKVREAEYIAKRNPALFPLLSKADFIVTVEGENVHARPRIAAEELRSSPPIRGTISVSTRSLDGPRSYAEVIQYWIDAQPTNDEISVTNAESLTNADLDLLKGWAQGLMPPWDMVHRSGETHFTIRPSRGREFTTAGLPLKPKIDLDEVPG